MPESRLRTAPLSRPPIETALFDLFKVGPGPSSSHTIGPMKAGRDFLDRCASLSHEDLGRAASVHVILLGSLSATGRGHGTDVAVLAGLLGAEPESCPPDRLSSLGRAPDAVHDIRLGERRIPIRLADIEFGPTMHDCPFVNTLRIFLRDGSGAEILGMEYYSVGGGFIQWKGWTPPDRGHPVHPYGTMRELRGRLHETGLTLHELILDNEVAITGMERRRILGQVEDLMSAMRDCVTHGLGASGGLPGTLGVRRKAAGLLDRSRHLASETNRFLGALNAYAFAASEENAGGGVIVTAPTCGSAGVLPALLRSMDQDMDIGARALREGLIASAAVGFLAKHNAGIAGAEVGCQGEVGVAAAMGAAMLAHARGCSVQVVENAAEIALEHHLGLTCDPVGGYVQIPCIERNAVGAIKAYNAALLAACEDARQHVVSLDAVIIAMGETGREMNAKFKETSEGGLAVSLVAC